MRYLIVLLAVCSSACSSSDSKQSRVEQEDTIRTLESQLPPVQPPQPAAIAPNRSLIGAIVTSVEIEDGLNYSISVELRTAIPIDGLESIAEPGQSVTLKPAYRRNEAGRIDPTDELNKRLYDLRSLKLGDFLMGKISLARDGVWYLEESGLK